MKYVFLTFTMEGVTGSPSYVNNKVKWLKEKGYEVVVFDHYGGLHLDREIVLENLLPYKDNRMLELFFSPAHFTKRQREKILDKLSTTIGGADDYVVESNSLRLSLWGELLAKRLHAKHLIFHVGEHVKICNHSEFEFINFKYERNELFAIKPKAIQNLFDGYRTINDEEAQTHYFSAIMGVVPEDVPLPDLEDLPDAKYMLLSFGRYKPYFENMINGVVDFANKYKDEKINFIIMGDVELPNSLLYRLDSVENLFYKFIPAMRPVPKSIFEYSDVVIATAGCANLAYKQGVKTISMNVETCLPLGVMGYTTVDSVYSTNNSSQQLDVCDLLEDVLIKRLYDGAPVMKKEASKKGYDFQLSLINDDRVYWNKVEKVYQDKNLLKRLVQTVVIRCGCIGFFAK